MNHPRALRHAAHREAVSRDRGSLRTGIGRQDRGRGCIPSGAGKRSGERPDTGEHAVHRQRRPDDAGGKHHDLGRLCHGAEHVLVLQRTEIRFGVLLAARPGRCVRDASVDDDRLRLGLGEVPFGHDHGRCLHPVRRPHGRPDCPLRRPDQREVEPRPPDTRGDARRYEPPRRGHAHTSTPERRSPSVSPKPKRRLAFWIACPAAPLPRLSIAHTTIVWSVKRSS